MVAQSGTSYFESEGARLTHGTTELEHVGGCDAPR